MIKTEIINKGARFKQVKTYVKEPTTNDSAIKKQKIVDVYPESLQLNLLRKAILGDETAKTELTNIENLVNSL